MNKRFIADDLEDVRDLVLKNKISVFSLFSGEVIQYFNKTILLEAHNTQYHVFIDAIDIENVICAEGIEVKYDGTDFGLMEMIITKIK